MSYVIAYDIGTTGVKTSLFQIDGTIKPVANAQQGYGLYVLENGGVEQDTEEWWAAMCATTREVFNNCEVKPEEVKGLSFCSQMQGLVLVDEDCKALRRPMSYMDQRAKEEIKKGIAYGPLIAGGNIFKVLPSVLLTGAVSTSVKDPVWKYKWVEAHEPEVFSKVYKWLDVKEYLIARCTHRCIMTPDSAYSTFLYATKKGKVGWSEKLCKLYGVNPKHLPEIVPVTAEVGGLTKEAAADLGLVVGTPVFGGGGDATLIGIGAGATRSGDTHIYSGTSGWVETVVDKQYLDVNAMIAAIVGAIPGKYNYFAEMETAGKCLEWVKDHLALDEIGVYLEKKGINEVENVSQERVYKSLYAYLTDVVKEVPPGAHGVIFTPWLHGNRCPFEDPNAAGMFFNIRIETGKTDMIKAVLEGVCYHQRWMLECQDKKIKTSDSIRFCGGGALSDVTSQILADVTGRTIEVVDHPQNVGAVGAAAAIGIGLGEIPNFDAVRDFVPAKGIFYPDPERHAAYEKPYQTFQRIYKANKELFAELNA